MAECGPWQRFREIYVLPSFVESEAKGPICMGSFARGAGGAAWHVLAWLVEGRPRRDLRPACTHCVCAVRTQQYNHDEEASRPYAWNMSVINKKSTQVRCGVRKMRGVLEDPWTFSDLTSALDVVKHKNVSCV